MSNFVENGRASEPGQTVDPFESIPKREIDRSKLTPRRNRGSISKSNLGFAPDIHSKPEGFTVRRRKVDHNRRTQDYLVSLGFIVERVDRWDHRMRRQIDYLGLFDIRAEKPGEIWLVQLTSKGQMSTRRNKMCSDDRAPDNYKPRVSNLRQQIALGNICVLIGWHQPGGEGTRWKPVVERITEETIQVVRERARKPKTT